MNIKDRSHLESSLVSRSGSICLFNKRHDYLTLPVIPMTINGRLFVYFDFFQDSEIIQTESALLASIGLVKPTKIIKLMRTKCDYTKSVSFSSCI